VRTTEATKKSPYPNVHRTSWGNAFYVQFRHGGQRYYLGTFGTAEEGNQAYLSAKHALGGIDAVPAPGC
jgi:hypothetical protein